MLREDWFRSVINLSDVESDKDTLRVLSKGLSFVPVPSEIDKLQLREDLVAIARRMRLAHFFEEDDPKPIDSMYRFREKSDWTHLLIWTSF
jgi:hypothetical protein